MKYYLYNLYGCVKIKEIQKMEATMYYNEKKSCFMTSCGVPNPIPSDYKPCLIDESVDPDVIEFLKERPYVMCECHMILNHDLTCINIVKPVDDVAVETVDFFLKVYNDFKETQLIKCWDGSIKVNLPQTRLRYFSKMLVPDDEKYIEEKSTLCETIGFLPDIGERFDFAANTIIPCDNGKYIRLDDGVYEFHQTHKIDN